MTIARLGCELSSPRALDVCGLRLHLLEAGITGSPALCFLHGGAAHAHWFDAVTPAFLDRFHVVALDQRGHGDSAWATPPAYATEDFAGDLLGMMDALGWRRMALVGHSMGGHNAMAFAAWYPERVSALVIVDSRPSLPADRIDRMRRRGQHPPRLHPTLESAVASFRLLPPETTADPTLLTHLARAGLIATDTGFKYRFDPACYASRRPADCWPLLSRIVAPTLIVRGELSLILPADMAARLHAAVAGSDLVEIPGAYHHLVLDTPKEFTEALMTFLARVPTG